MLASGTGSILQAVIDAELPVALVVTDRRCGAIEVAENAGVPVELIERTDFSKAFDRDGYTRLIVESLKHHDIELVAMAGFGTIIPGIWDSYPDRVLNTHPALLPAFPGMHGARDALAYGVKVTGCTVHFATPEMDAGPILAQEAVPVLPDDTEETLHERIKQVERRLYPATIKRVMEGTR